MSHLILLACLAVAVCSTVAHASVLSTDMDDSKFGTMLAAGHNNGGTPNEPQQKPQNSGVSGDTNALIDDIIRLYLLTKADDYLNSNQDGDEDDGDYDDLTENVKRNAVLAHLRNKGRYGKRNLRTLAMHLRRQQYKLQ